MEIVKQVQENLKELREERASRSVTISSLPHLPTPPEVWLPMVEQATQTATLLKHEVSVQTDVSTSTCPSDEIKELRRKLEDQGRIIEALEQQVGDLGELEKQRVAQCTRYPLQPLILAMCTTAT